MMARAVGLQPDSSALQCLSGGSVHPGSPQVVEGAFGRPFKSPLPHQDFAQDFWPARAGCIRRKGQWLARPANKANSMLILITLIHIMVCLFLIIVVLLQSGQSGDIAAAFGGQGSQTAFGPRGSATVLSRATTWSAIIFMVNVHYAVGFCLPPCRTSVGLPGRQGYTAKGCSTGPRTNESSAFGSTEIASAQLSDSQTTLKAGA